LSDLKDTDCILSAEDEKAFDSIRVSEDGDSKDIDQSNA
jgi:hypothetical protein